MAQPREPTFQQSSPVSSKGGADSYKHEGTPDTRLTAFSPDENSAKSTKMVKSIALGVPEAQLTRFPVNPGGSFRGTQGLNLEKDPFVSPATTTKSGRKLSATALTFRPFSTTPIVAHGSGDSTAPAPHDEIGLDEIHHAVPLSSLPSTELGLSRCLVISAPSQPLTATDVENYLTKLENLGSPCQGDKQIQAKNTRIYLRFTNIRDACMVQRHVQLCGTDWIVTPISPPEFVQIATPGSRLATPYEGQLSVLALVRQGVGVDTVQVESTVRQVLQAEGDLFAFQKEFGFQDGTLRALVEFADTNVALTVFWKYRQGLTVHGIQIVLSLHKNDGFASLADPHEGVTTPIATPLRSPMQDLAASFQSMSSMNAVTSPRSMMSSAGSNTPSPVGLPVQTQFTLYPMVYRNHFTTGSPVVFDNIPTRSNVVTPMTNHSFPLVGPLFSPATTASQALSMTADFAVPRTLPPFNRPDARRQHAMRVTRSPYYNAAGHHNHVDVNRIREGIDVRTTIMLRNIPNKVDQVMLKAIVDESSWGKYDFMYLRIDFANDCNVGYAFINFVDPLDIIDFVNARGNQRWNCFKSDKVAEISYATIQGKDCLVQKFRNSSVMLEAPHYRPKLYFTSNGPMPELAGQEEQFPEPDNQSKMKRSCENAEHVGLFTPNAGQHFRDEQRRRRSQYDRGTRLAALEEYDYETAIQHMYSPQ